jgi:hypothetical protein
MSMNTPGDPGAVYARCLEQERVERTREQRWLTWLVRVRIADLVLAVVLAGQACSRGGHFGFPTGVSVLVFVALTIVIAMVEERSKRLDARVRYYEDGVSRVQGIPVNGAPDGQRFADPAHPFAVDLDIFGSGSIFAHVCMARTASGQARLSQWLLQASPVETIQARQRAVAELRANLPLRRDLWLSGGTLREEVRQDALADWLSAQASPVSTWQRALTTVVGALGLVVLYAFAKPEVIPLAVGIVLVQRLWAQRHRKLTKAVEAQVGRRAYELKVISAVAERLAQEQFADSTLAELARSLGDGAQSASRSIARLGRLVNWLESRHNQLFAIPAFVLLLPEQLSFAIEAWRARQAAAALRWLSTIAEMEALASLGTFAFEHPDYVFPEILEKAEAAFVAQGLGHPLIPANARVANDVRLDASCRLLVVTGSNMSGKSTLLRSVGVNAVLAQAGAPVCATSLLLTSLHVGASLRAQDSLEAGVSRFFAEIKRLHAILTIATQTPPVLFLLDEILNGTNSQDRREGAEAVIRSLLDRGAIGLVTTHDLSLSELADRPGSAGRNVHFQDTLEDDRLVFDYRLHPGVVTRRNALDLMRLVGIDVSHRHA